MRYSAKINALLAGAPLSFQFHAENIVCSGLGRILLLDHIKLADLTKLAHQG
ncbi:uncharacterized protein PHALS_12930 [Plasmopara halstedii]|uniref:Uncharacterized protein n=1 Tax=Plasmopara halstedii TaxID=4781 RepID=A0A0P1ANB4_PLAHL|nr:uncharacterized protein PHALS_12930 [Plasmopara halstedii]CEG42674.1 hypothetical protein PHALS_12930 [Plasmopara halstedii]|eukprot:XP_024579043.1 hypothetical protein PHALS_12930 [Plasmopara halstedii]